MLKVSECVYQVGGDTPSFELCFLQSCPVWTRLNMFYMFMLWYVLVGGWTVAASSIDFALAEKSCGGCTSCAGCNQLPQFAATGPAPLLWFSVTAGTESCSAELTQPLPEAFCEWSLTFYDGNQMCCKKRKKSTKVLHDWAVRLHIYSASLKIVCVGDFALVSEPRP